MSDGRPPSERVRAVADHGVPARAPLRVEPGDEFEVGEHSREWPAFVFVSSAAGAGWVPIRYLRVSGRRAVAEHSYDTRELAVTAGETLELVERDNESEWHWCRNSRGDEGWVPAEVLELLD